MQKTFFALKGTHFFLSATILSAEFINRLLKLRFCGGNIFLGGVFNTKKRSTRQDAAYTINLHFFYFLSLQRNNITIFIENYYYIFLLRILEIRKYKTIFEFTPKNISIHSRTS